MATDNVQRVLVASDRFGDIEVDTTQVLHFPEGLLGFPDARRFAMFDPQGTDTYYWLQSVDDPSLAFLTVVPWVFCPEYEPELPPEDEERLGLEAPTDAIVLCLLTVHREAGVERPSGITANLLGPLVVNATTRLGRQVVLVEGGHPLRAPLA
jgi:flagellar assembly factor FliW